MSLPFSRRVRSCSWTSCKSVLFGGTGGTGHCNRRKDAASAAPLAQACTAMVRLSALALVLAPAAALNPSVNVVVSPGI